MIAARQAGCQSRPSAAAARHATSNGTPDDVCQAGVPSAKWHPRPVPGASRNAARVQSSKLGESEITDDASTIPGGLGGMGCGVHAEIKRITENSLVPMLCWLLLR